MTEPDSLISGGGETSLPQGNSVITTLPPDFYIQTDAAKKAQNIRVKMRRNAIEFFGGKCIRCGFSDERALQFDHISGGGFKDLKKRGSNSGYFKYVIKNKEKFQLLCANCNWIKRHERKENPQGKHNSNKMLEYWRKVKTGEIKAPIHKRRIGPRIQISNRQKEIREKIENMELDGFFVKRENK